VPGGGALRKQIFESKNGDAVLNAIESFFVTRATTTEKNDAVGDVDETMLASAAAYCD